MAAILDVFCTGSDFDSSSRTKGRFSQGYLGFACLEICFEARLNWCLQYTSRLSVPLEIPCRSYHVSMTTIYLTLRHKIRKFRRICLSACQCMRHSYMQNSWEEVANFPAARSLYVRYVRRSGSQHICCSATLHNMLLLQSCLRGCQHSYIWICKVFRCILNSRQPAMGHSS